MLMKSLKICALVALVVLVISTDAFAQTGTSNNAVFNTIMTKATSLFKEVRTIVFIMGGFGLVGLAVASVFGRPMWKWFALLALGLVVVAVAGAVVEYFSEAGNVGERFNDTLK